jgi:hypothetical protein
MKLSLTPNIFHQHVAHMWWMSINTQEWLFFASIHIVKVNLIMIDHVNIFLKYLSIVI